MLADAGGVPELILLATGSEVSVAVDAHKQLAAKGVRSRVVSLPCWQLFDQQPQAYRDQVLPPSVTARISIEAASPLGWERYVGSLGAVIGMTRFGASAPAEALMKEFGFTPDHVVARAQQLLVERVKRNA